MIKKIINHLRNGSLLKVTGEKIRYELGIQKKTEPTRWGADSEEKAIEFLALRAAEIAAQRKKNVIVLVVQHEGDEKKFRDHVKASGLDIRIVRLASLHELTHLPAASIACIVSAGFDAGSTMAAGRFLMQQETLREIPYEYILLPDLDFKRIKKVDRYKDNSFTSPLFSGPVDFMAIYEESLTRFEQKCDIRDYMDLCQCLLHIVKNNIPGAIAEFGSFRGHSGYLITRTLKALGADKDVYLFDMFESFPSESLGVDYFWDKHEVNFEEVKSKFAAFRNVRLVKGDFTETIREFPDVKFSFIFVDCDSYRATRFLVNHLFDRQLSPGGLFIFEDYGHPALLGNRLAVHECFDMRTHCFTFYSQYSGFYVVAKNFHTISPA